MIDRVVDSARRWPDFAIAAGVTDARIKEIQTGQRVGKIGMRK